MSSFREYLAEQLKNPEFKKEWDNLEVDCNIIQAMIDVGVNNHITQNELVERTEIDKYDKKEK